MLDAWWCLIRLQVNNWNSCLATCNQSNAWKTWFPPNSVLLAVLNAFLRCPPWCWICLPLCPLVSPLGPFVSLWVCVRLPEGLVSPCLPSCLPSCFHLLDGVFAFPEGLVSRCLPFCLPLSPLVSPCLPLYPFLFPKQCYCSGFLMLS